MKQLKKWLAFIMIAALLVVGIDGGKTTIQAAENPKVYADNVSAAAGDEISIPVKISGNTGIMGLGMKVTYDRDVLTPQSVTIGAVLKGTFDHNAAEAEGDSFDILWAGTENISADGELFVMTFQVAEDAKAGATEIALSYSQEDTFQESYEDVALDCQNITVTVGGSGVTPSPVSSKTPSPTGSVMEDFHVYFGYANTSWTESFFHDQMPGIVISGDGDYRISHTIQQTDTDIEVLLLDTDLEYSDVVDRLEIIPTKLVCSGVNYSIEKYWNGSEPQGDGSVLYRVLLRNPYVGDGCEGLDGMEIPVKAGDEITIDFTVAGMGKQADTQPTDAPSETPSVEPSATPQVDVTSGPGVTAKPNENTKHTLIKKPARVKIKKLKKAGKGCAKVTWKKVKCSDGYQIQYSRKRSFAGKKKTTASGKGTYIWGKSKKKYYVRVRAVNWGWKTQTSLGYKYGKWSKVKSIKLK